MDKNQKDIQLLIEKIEKKSGKKVVLEKQERLSRISTTQDVGLFVNEYLKNSITDLKNGAKIAFDVKYIYGSGYEVIANEK